MSGKIDERFIERTPTVVTNVTELERAITNQDKDIFIKNGTYSLTQTITPYSGLTLRGESKDGVILSYAGSIISRSASADISTTSTLTLVEGENEIVYSGSTLDSASVGDLLWHTDVSSNIRLTYRIMDIDTTNNRIFLNYQVPDSFISSETVWVFQSPIDNLTIENMTLTSTSGTPVRLDAMYSLNIKNIDITGASGQSPLDIRYSSVIDINRISLTSTGGNTGYLNVQRCTGVNINGVNSHGKNAFPQISFEYVSFSSFRNINGTSFSIVYASHCVLENLTHTVGASSTVDIADLYRCECRNIHVTDTTADMEVIFIDNVDTTFINCTNRFATTWGFDLQDNTRCKFINFAAPNAASPHTTGGTTYDSTIEVNGEEHFYDSNGVLRYKRDSSGVLQSTGLSVDSASLTTDGTSDVDIDWSTSDVKTITLTGDIAFTFSNPTAVSTYTIIITQDGIGSRNVTWPASVKWEFGNTPTLSSGASSIDMVTLIYDGTNYYGGILYDFS